MLRRCEEFTEDFCRKGRSFGRTGHRLEYISEIDLKYVWEHELGTSGSAYGSLSGCC